MKKLLFLLAGAFVAFTASAQTPSVSASPASAVKWNPSELATVKAGFCPEYYQGYLCGIFVTIEKVKNSGEIVGLVDPHPQVYQIRSSSDWVDITDQVLIDYNVWFEPQGDVGTLHCSFTYQYPGGERQTFSVSIDSYPGGE